MVAIGAVFLCTATFARDETVSGWLVPKGGLIRVSSRSGGVLEQVFVKEGDAVKAGQPIARIRLITALSGGMDAVQSSKAALDAQANAIDVQGHAARAKLLKEQADLGPRLVKLRAQLASAREQVAYQEQRITLARADVARFERLFRAGAMAERDLDSSRASLLAAQQTLAQEQASALGVEQQIQETDARLHAIPEDLASAKATMASADADLAQRRIQTSAQNTDLLVASVAGRVLALPADNGQSLGAGTAVAVIAPTGAKLEAELYAPSRAVGFVKPGETVRLMYQAFPHEKFGSAKATITSVSKTILAPSDVAIPGVSVQQPVFRVRAALADQSQHAYGQTIPLQSGMLLTASIIFDRRSLLEWLLDPIYAVRR